MNTRERIAEAAQKAGFRNAASEGDQKYWGVDEWRKGRRYVRVNYDTLGRVRDASWGNGRESKFFGGYRQAEQIINKINSWTEGK